MDEKHSEGVRGGAGLPGGDQIPSARADKAVNLCPLCGLDVPPAELRCPRCHALLVTACSGACASCGSRTCLRPDDED